MGDRPASVVSSIGRDPYKTGVVVDRGAGARGHTVTVDEPVALGGQDLGATPVELLLGSIGSCKVITCRMYADRKGWAVETIASAVTHVPGGGSDGSDLIEVEMEYVGDLTGEQRNRLDQISEKCPVAKMVSRGTEVRTVVVGS